MTSVTKSVYYLKNFHHHPRSFPKPATAFRGLFNTHGTAAALVQDFLEREKIVQTLIHAIFPLLKKRKINLSGRLVMTRQVRLIVSVVLFCCCVFFLSPTRVSRITTCLHCFYFFPDSVNLPLSMRTPE